MFVLDLDFTLLHLERVEDAIEVPGRTRSAWIAPATVEALRVLGRVRLVLATARSEDGTRPVVKGLAARGVTVTGVVLEDGALWGPSDAVSPLETRDWEALRADMEARREPSWPLFEWQRDFRACLVARASGAAAAVALEAEFARAARDFNVGLRSFRDGRKVYLTGASADKWRALQRLAGDEAARAIGIGDGLNDLCWLRRIAHPCTLSGAAPEVVQLVRERGGYVSPFAEHKGIADVLQHLAAWKPSPTPRA